MAHINSALQFMVIDTFPSSEPVALKIGMNSLPFVVRQDGTQENKFSTRVSLQSDFSKHISIVV